jgi:hypothetical protein
MTKASSCSIVIMHPGETGKGVEKATMNNEISRCSSVVEHFLGKEGVMGSTPINGS